MEVEMASDSARGSVDEVVDNVPTSTWSPDDIAPDKASEEIEPVISSESPSVETLSKPVEIALGDSLVHQMQAYVPPPVPAVVPDLVSETFDTQKPYPKDNIMTPLYQDPSSIPEVPNLEPVEIPKESTPVEQVVDKQNEDDSSLYSIRNFNI
jgi:hypothetical protein